MVGGTFSPGARGRPEGSTTVVGRSPARSSSPPTTPTFVSLRQNSDSLAMDVPTPPELELRPLSQSLKDAPALWTRRPAAETVDRFVAEQLIRRDEVDFIYENVFRQLALITVVSDRIRFWRRREVWELTVLGRLGSLVRPARVEGSSSPAAGRRTCFRAACVGSGRSTATGVRSEWASRPPSSSAASSRSSPARCGSPKSCTIGPS